MVAVVGAKPLTASTFGDGFVGAPGRIAGYFTTGLAAVAFRVNPDELDGTSDVAKQAASLMAASAVA